MRRHEHHTTLYGEHMAWLLSYYHIYATRPSIPVTPVSMHDDEISHENSHTRLVLVSAALLRRRRHLKGLPVITRDNTRGHGIGLLCS